MRLPALIGLACTAGITAAQGQLTPTLDAGVSAVKYDGFLISGAASLTPSVRWEHPRGRGFISARGTYLRFESGNRSIDFSASGAWFTPVTGRWRGEFGLTAGASDYARIASFSHGLAEARIHLIDAGRGGWVSATVGRASFGTVAGTRPVGIVALGVWLLRRDLTLFGSVDRSFVGDTSYTDIRSAARLLRGRLSLEGTLGARLLSRGGGRGFYGEATTTVPLGRQTALILSAGRYPRDAVSGSISARYVTMALRLGGRALALRQPARQPLAVQIHSSGANGLVIEPAEARLEISAGDEESVQLTVFAPGATTVEISGDFTDWRPVSLSRRATTGDAWEARFRISRGVHRVNVRRDGGRWMAPAGTTRSLDDFDGEVGIFLLP